MLSLARTLISPLAGRHCYITDDRGRTTEDRPMKDGLDQSSEDQDAVFRFLADPATHGGAAIKRINTHAASVFVAGPVAYKVKRAVRFPFLDFSTLEKRQAALEAEIAANRPFAPE